MRARVGRAFTLVELVIVIAIVGILAAIAVPRFIDIRQQAYQAARDSIIGSVRAGILTVAAQNQATGASSGTFPPNLEQAWGGSAGGTVPGAFEADCNATDECFELVVSGGLIDAQWKQSAALAYKFRSPVNAADNRECTYVAGTAGTFTCVVF
jgi:prepilin-type N-terminal cleavage/methylation domain-containing protein